MNNMKQLVAVLLLASSLLAAPAPQVGISAPAPRYGVPPPHFSNVDLTPQAFSPTPVKPALSEPSLVGVFSELPDAEDYPSDEGCQPTAVQTVFITLTETVPLRGNSMKTQVKVYPTTVYQTQIQQQTSTIVQTVTQTVFVPRYTTESVTRTEQTIYSLTTTHTVHRYQTVPQTEYVTQTMSVVKTNYLTLTKEVTSYITQHDTEYSTVTDLRTRFITQYIRPVSMYGRAPTVPAPPMTKGYGFY